VWGSRLRRMPLTSGDRSLPQPGVIVAVWPRLPYLICECRCGAPGRRTDRLGAGDPMSYLIWPLRRALRKTGPSCRRHRPGPPASGARDDLGAAVSDLSLAREPSAPRAGGSAHAAVPGIGFYTSTWDPTISVRSRGARPDRSSSRRVQRSHTHHAPFAIDLASDGTHPQDLRIDVCTSRTG
jgi:hypothetical protein